MKTSNKILIFCGLLLISLPLIEVYLVKDRMEKEPPLIEGFGRGFYSKEELPKFKYMKIIGNDSVKHLSSGINFSYNDNSFLYLKKDDKKKDYTINLEKDTLIITLGKNVEYWKERPRLHLFSPNLENVIIQKAYLEIDGEKENVSDDDLCVFLKESRLFMRGRNFDEASSISYNSVKVEGENSFFESVITSKNTTVDLKGKSTLIIKKGNHQKFSTSLSEESHVEVYSPLNEFITYEKK